MLGERVGGGAQGAAGLRGQLGALHATVEQVGVGSASLRGQLQAELRQADGRVGQADRHAALLGLHHEATLARLSGARHRRDAQLRNGWRRGPLGKALGSRVPSGAGAGGERRGRGDAGGCWGCLHAGGPAARPLCGGAARSGVMARHDCWSGTLACLLTNVCAHVNAITGWP